MEVIIAGYNKTTEENLNPEIISASYARTSRDPRSIPEIRDDAKHDVERARKSNKAIVFDMGHASIAEHTVFNIDIIGVSRYLVEEIESHRLASYTEKSQRYVLFDGDYTIPKEIVGTDLEMEFCELAEEQNKFYHELYPILVEYFKEKNPEKYEKEPKTVEGWAKEDARYCISMATQTQLGMTINARNLEMMIRRLRTCNFEEAHELANLLYEKVYEITPSLFPYTEPSPFEIKQKNIFRDNSAPQDEDIVMFTKGNGDEKLETVLSYITPDFDSSDDVILESLKDMKVFDSAPREFEMIDFEFSLVISSSCFAQLKRHRMMTIIPSDYSFEIVIPQSVRDTGMTDKFIEITNKSFEFSERLFVINSRLSPYILTNAHCRIVYIKLNLREFYHFCRMRRDSHAQWEIRNVANEMHRLASEICPKGLSLACGKHEFNETYKRVYGDN